MLQQGALTCRSFRQTTDAATSAAAEGLLAFAEQAAKAGPQDVNKGKRKRVRVKVPGRHNDAARKVCCWKLKQHCACYAVGRVCPGTGFVQRESRDLTLRDYPKVYHTDGLSTMADPGGWVSSLM